MQMPWQEPRSQLPDWVPVSQGAKEAFSFIGSCPLISKPDLSNLMGYDAPYSYPLVKELADSGLVTSVPLGGVSARADRLYVPPYGRQFLTVADRSWQDDGARSVLLSRFPVAETLPLAASSVEGMGRLLSFNWYQGMAWDAAARYETGFVPIFWSGLLQRERRVRQTLLNLGPDLLEVASPGRNPRPGMLCFVVPDAWQAQVVRRAARGFGLEDRIMFCYIWDRSATPAARPVESVGGITTQIADAYVGNWPWEARVAASPWSGDQPRRFYRQLQITAEWPRTHLDFARSVLLEKPQSRNTQRMQALLRGGDGPWLHSNVERGVHRYTVNNKSFHLLATIDRVANNQIPAANLGPAGMGNSPVHDDEVMAAFGQFVANGLKVANGWRSWERWGHGGIEPDGMIFLNFGPFGAGWHYYEHERTARRRARAERKFRRYLAPRRQDDFPVLFALWDDEAEETFHRIGRENAGRPDRARLLTTTRDRLARYGALGDGCWSWYGEPVRLG